MAYVPFSFSASVHRFSNKTKDVGSGKVNETAEANLYPPKLPKSQPGYFRQGEFSLGGCSVSFVGCMKW